VAVFNRKINDCNSSGFKKGSATIAIAKDYTKFGSPLAGRSLSGEGYRFSFNGMITKVN